MDTPYVWDEFVRIRATCRNPEKSGLDPTEIFLNHVRCAPRAIVSRVIPLEDNGWMSSLMDQIHRPNGAMWHKLHVLTQNDRLIVLTEAQRRSLPKMTDHAYPCSAL